MKTASVKCLLIAAVAALLGGTLSVRADRQVDPFKANDSYPLTNPTAHEQPASVRTGQHPWSQSSDSVTDYPATEVRAVPAARAASVRAKWEYYRAKDNLYQTVDFLREDFEDSGDARTAKTAQQAAHDQYDSVRRRILQRLLDDPQYAATRKLRDQADEQVQRLRAERPLPIAHLAAAARVKMDFSQKLSEMENDALFADPEYREARATLTVAGQDMARIRTAFARGIRRDQDFREARKDWEDARIDYVVAATYRDAVVEARNIAVTYAYRLHDYDLYKYLHTGSYAPYYSGYGNGSGLGYNYAPVATYSSMFRY